jgi:hypothetical protein
MASEIQLDGARVQMDAVFKTGYLKMAHKIDKSSQSYQGSDAQVVLHMSDRPIRLVLPDGKAIEMVIDELHLKPLVVADVAGNGSLWKVCQPDHLHNLKALCDELAT